MILLQLWPWKALCIVWVHNGLGMYGLNETSYDPEMHWCEWVLNDLRLDWAKSSAYDNGVGDTSGSAGALL